MDKKRIFSKYHKRLVFEGILKASICSLIVGFGASIVPACIAAQSNNFNNNNVIGFWIALALGATIMAISIPLFYVMFFRPKTKDMVARIDRLGMDQRLITMLELEKDSSYMAMIQREDAKERLKSIRPRSLRFTIFVLPVVVLVLMAFSSAAMVAVTTTEFDARMPWSSVGTHETAEPEVEFAETPEPEEQPDANITYYKVIFYVMMGPGYFVGDSFQVVQRGDTTTLVIATPMSGWGFAYWDMEHFDEDDPQRTNPERIIENVEQDHLLWARFVPASESEDGEESDKRKETPEDSEEEEKPDPSNIVAHDNRFDSEKYWSDYYNDFVKDFEGEAIPDDLREMMDYYLSQIAPSQ